MKITKTKLKQIIKEEVQLAIKEGGFGGDPYDIAGSDTYRGVKKSNLTIAPSDIPEDAIVKQVDEFERVIIVPDNDGIRWYAEELLNDPLDPYGENYWEADGRSKRYARERYETPEAAMQAARDAGYNI